MMGVFAEFERAMIRERVKAGLARAKGEGKRWAARRLLWRPEKAVARSLKGGKLGMHKVFPAAGATDPQVRQEFLRIAENLEPEALAKEPGELKPTATWGPGQYLGKPCIDRQLKWRSC